MNSLWPPLPVWLLEFAAIAVLVCFHWRQRPTIGRLLGAAAALASALPIALFLLYAEPGGPRGLWYILGAILATWIAFGLPVFFVAATLALLSKWPLSRTFICCVAILGGMLLTAASVTVAIGVACGLTGDCL